MGDWIDAESLQQIIVVVMVALAIAAVLVARVVRRLLLRFLLILLIGALAASLWLQRADLADCVDTCSCRLFGQKVAVPADANPNCP